MTVASIHHTAGPRQYTLCPYQQEHDHPSRLFAHWHGGHACLCNRETWPILMPKKWLKYFYLMDYVISVPLGSTYALGPVGCLSGAYSSNRPTPLPPDERQPRMLGNVKRPSPVWEPVMEDPEDLNVAGQFYTRALGPDEVASSELAASPNRDYGEGENGGELEDPWVLESHCMGRPLRNSLRRLPTRWRNLALSNL